MKIRKQTVLSQSHDIFAQDSIATPPIKDPTIGSVDRAQLHKTYSVTAS